jgi:hypothetical protein
MIIIISYEMYSTLARRILNQRAMAMSRSNNGARWYSKWFDNYLTNNSLILPSAGPIQLAFDQHVK